MIEIIKPDFIRIKCACGMNTFMFKSAKAKNRIFYAGEIVKCPGCGKGHKVPLIKFKEAQDDA